MNIFILGAGKMGAYLAKVLSEQEHRVILADKNWARLEEINNTMDVATVYCKASHSSTLQDMLGTAQEFFISMTGNDETNLAACAIAKNLGYKTTICRITELGYLQESSLDFPQLFSVDHFLAADVLSAQQLLQKLLFQETLHEQFFHGNILMTSLSIPDSWSYSKVPIESLKLPKELVIGLIARENRFCQVEESSTKSSEKKAKRLIFPHGQDCLEKQDQVMAIGDAAAIRKLEKMFSIKKTKCKKVCIIGGTPIAVHLADKLQKLDIQVKIVEEKMNQCKYLAKILPDATILHHDATDISFLLAESIEQSDVFITAMHQDNQNLFTAAIGKKIGASYVLSVVSDPAFATVFAELGIPYVLSGKIHVTNQILSILHNKNILSISSIFNDLARVVEIQVSKNSTLTGMPLSALSAYLPKDLLVCIIESKGNIMIATGDHILSTGDKIIIIASAHRVQELENLF